MDKTLEAMVRNIPEKTGKTIEEWTKTIEPLGFDKHGQVVQYLKEEYGLTFGYADLISHKVRKTDSGSVKDKDSLISSQYKGKEHFIPIYNKLIDEVLKFGNDVDISPKKTWVSLRRKKQFAMLIPATKSRYEIGLNLKGHEPEGVLKLMGSKNSMCSHLITLETIDDISKEVLGWVLQAYKSAG